MKRTIIVLFVIVFCALNTYGQTLKITDKTTGKAVPDVEIVNTDQTKTTITNRKGEAILDNFSKSDSLVVTHTSYQAVIIGMNKLKDMDYKLDLYPGIIRLKETVVSANRWEQKRKEVPVKIDILGADDIRRIDPQTSADMLARSGNVYVQKSQMGGGSPMIRGFATNKVLIVVDGIRMNNAIYRHGNIQNVLSVDPNTLESSEVIFGPGSVIYGSDAIGGVMDFHTLQPEFSQNDTLLINGNALLRYNSGNYGKTGHFDFNIATQKFSSLTSITYSDFSDLTMGRKGLSNDLKDDYLRNNYVTQIDGQDSVIPNSNPHLARGSGFSQLHILQKLKYKLSEKSSLQYSFYYSTSSDIPRYDRLIQQKSGTLKYADWYYGPQKWMVNSLKFMSEKETKLWDEIKVHAAYQNYEESRHDRKLNSETKRHRIENVNMFTFNADAFKAIDSKNALFYGVESTVSKIFSEAYNENIFTGEEEDIGTRYPDNSDYSSAAAYISYRWLINPDLTFNSGARMNYVYAFSPFDRRFYNFPFPSIVMNSYSPNAMAGLVYSPNDKWRISGNLSTGFRAPNIDDLGKVFDSEPGSVVVPNPDLSPEYAWNADINVSKTFSNSVRIEGGGFYTVLTDAMQRGDYTFNDKDSIMYDGQLSQVQAIQNTGRVDVYGFSAALYADILSNLSFKSTFNYTVGEDQDGNPYRHVPPLFGSTHLRFRAGKLSADLWADYNGERAPEDLSPEEHGKAYMYAVDEDYAEEQDQLPEEERFNEEGLYSPSWYSINFKLDYAINESLMFSAGVENITDQLYRPYSSGIPAMGRRFILSLKGSF